jgi:oxygen-independent coproporphyrinogen-3 oxidase
MPPPPLDEPAAGTPLYVHLPFCAAKCPYCDFYSLPGDGEDTAGAIEVVLREAVLRSPRAPRTVFLGGGTPSYHSIAELRRLFDGLDAATGFRASAHEVTVECNPESLTADKAAALFELGATRLSIGFQSLDPATLKLFGRVHDVAQSFRAYDAARAAGFERVSVDLIFAAPGQTVAAWMGELERVLALAPDHVSAYALTFEEGTPFHAWRRAGELRELPEEEELELFLATRARLSEAGLPAYEISNFASKAQECAHNLNYWRNGPYVGIGPSAASKIGRRRFARPRSVARWARAVAGELPADEAWSYAEELDDAGRLGETWWLGLRLADGVDPTEARAAADFPATAAGDRCVAVAEECVGLGLLERAGRRYRLSARGLTLADHVAARFLAG